MQAGRMETLFNPKARQQPHAADLDAGVLTWEVITNVLPGRATELDR